MYTSRDEQLGQLLGAAIAALDISDEEFEAAEAGYRSLAAFLCIYWGDSDAGGAVYPQGSMRLGTVTGIIHRNDEYDLDLVCRRNLAKDSITQAELKSDVGFGLEMFVKSVTDDGPELDDEGKRCWTLKYPGRPFHLDVLPALPDADAEPNGLILTDIEEEKEWPRSNPIDFADWFHGVMRAEWLQKAAGIAENRMDVADVPHWKVKTSLQRTVQALKRHRDLFFAEDLHNRTASVIITTLAALAYRPGGSLYEVLTDITSRMPALVKVEGGVLTVRNPIQSDENFADRWRSHPERAERFFQWIEQAHRDFAAIGKQSGMDQILKKTAASLGPRAAKHAEETFGSGLRESRRAGQLGLAAGTTTLITGAPRAMPPHGFHGDV